MNIVELRVGQDKVEVEGDITDKTETREFNKFGRVIRVATATLQDSSGNIKISLWNDDADRINVGDRIKISNGFVKEFQGEKQLTSGKFGKIEVLGKAEKGERRESCAEAKKNDEGLEPTIEGAETVEGSEEIDDF